jgi:hypothetical protein
MGEGRVVHSVLVGKPEGKRPLWRPICRWEDNINPLPLQLKVLLPGLERCVFSRGISIYVLHQKQVAPPGKKIITIKLKKQNDKSFFILFVINICM